MLYPPIISSHSTTFLFQSTCYLTHYIYYCQYPPLEDKHHESRDLCSLILFPIVSQYLPECLVCATAAAKSLRLCLILCDPIDSSPPGSSVPGILQARILEWFAISFSNLSLNNVIFSIFITTVIITFTPPYCLMTEG